jgi:uncharacterized membrane protein YfcA
MLIALVVFFAAMIQGLLGFGGALIAMPLLVMLIGIQAATPVFALVGTLSTLLNAVRLRSHTTPKDLIRLVAPAIVGIPLGILLLTRVDSELITAVLGIILVAYALYNLLGWVMPRMSHPAWAYLAGFSSGILSGAFNTGGPPVIVYASARRWTADQFRANLQTYFLIISVFLVVGHGLSGHFTADVWRMALLAVPALLVGQALGVLLCRYVEADFFRKLVLVFLLLLGVQLIVG